MNNTNSCPERIKPLLLRDIKTEALLVFIRTTLEQFFIDLEKNNICFTMGTVDDNIILHNSLKDLLFKLQKHVVNSTYIRNIIQMSQKNKNFYSIIKKEEPLMVYYDGIVRQISNSLSAGQNWIPEQLVICLLSEWILEEEKSIKFYPFLEEINYSNLLYRYDKIRIDAKKNNELDKVSAIMNMYKVGNDLISKLKNITYKVNTNRISKKRNRR